jgi:hypothetical protein
MKKEAIIEKEKMQHEFELSKKRNMGNTQRNWDVSKSQNGMDDGSNSRGGRDSATKKSKAKGLRQSRSSQDFSKNPHYLHQDNGESEGNLISPQRGQHFTDEPTSKPSKFVLTL